MGDIRYNKTIVKNINESLIRKALRGEAPFTKTRIARETELSFPTVSRIIDEMTRTGEILLSGMDDTTGGRHAQAFILNPNFAYCLCMYMTEYHHLRYFLIDSLGQTVVDGVREVKELKPTLVNIMDEIVAEHMDIYPIKALSIGLPWGISSDGTILYCAAPNGLFDYPLQRHMEEKFGIRTRVENDMNTMVTGCYKRMFKEDGRSMVLVNLGYSGCGCGLYLRGQLVRGYHGFAGELRFMPTDRENTIAYALEQGLAEDPMLAAQVVASLCCIIDPHTIVFYKNQNTDNVIKEVKELCKKFIPEEVVPELVVSDSRQEDFENGLISFGLDLLVVGYEIVNR